MRSTGIESGARRRGHQPGEGPGTLTVQPVEALLRGPADRSAGCRRSWDRGCQAGPVGCGWSGGRLRGRPRSAWPARSRLAPPELQERDAVLADLDLLLASDERWCWVQARPSRARPRYWPGWSPARRRTSRWPPASCAGRSARSDPGWGHNSRRHAGPTRQARSPPRRGRNSRRQKAKPGPVQVITLTSAPHAARGSRQHQSVRAGSAVSC